MIKKTLENKYSLKGEWNSHLKERKSIQEVEKKKGRACYRNLQLVGTVKGRVRGDDTAAPDREACSTRLGTRPYLKGSP